MSNSNISSNTKTPFGKLLFGMLIGQSTYTMATVIPLAILLTFKFLEIDPQNVTVDFSLASGVGALVGVIFNYIGGAISDRTTFFFGRRRTWILIGSAIGAASLMGIALTKSVTMVVVFWSIGLASYSTSFAAYSALFSDQVEEKRRGTASGVIGLFNPVAILVGMVILTALNNLNLTTKYGVVAAISLIGALITCILVKDAPIKQYISNKDSNNSTFGEKLSKFYPSPKKYPAFTWGVITRLLVCTAFASQVYATLYFMQKFNIPQEEVTGVATLNSLIQTIGLGVSAILGGMLSDKFRKQKPFVAGAAVIVAIGVFVAAIAPTVQVVFIGTGILGFGYGAYIAVDMALIARILPNPQDAAKDFGIMNIAGQLPQSIVPVVAPALIGAGGFTLLYGVLAVTGLLSAAAVAPIPEMSSKPIEEVVAGQN